MVLFWNREHNQNNLLFQHGSSSQSSHQFCILWGFYHLNILFLADKICPDSLSSYNQIHFSKTQRKKKNFKKEKEDFITNKPENKYFNLSENIKLSTCKEW